jgi:hypothetical protein
LKVYAVISSKTTTRLYAAEYRVGAGFIAAFSPFYLEDVSALLTHWRMAP